MGVVIKDFKLPESCDECQFNRCNTVDDTCHCEIKYLDTTDLFICRHDKCPLVDTDDCDTKYINKDEIIMKKFINSLSPDQYARLKEIVDNYSR